MSKPPRGYFEYCLALDSETTGLFFNNQSPSPVVNEKDGTHHQAVSWGMAIVDNNFTIVDELYVEIQWNGKSLWSNQAEAVHGLSKEHLAKHGKTEEDAICDIYEFITKYFPDSSIVTLGHNHVSFDLKFLANLVERHGLPPLNFANRSLDSNGVGFATVGSYNSDDLFTTMGSEERDDHNALDDVKMTVNVFKTVKMLWDAKIGIKV